MPEYAQTLTYLFAVMVVLLQLVLVIAVFARVVLKKWPALYDGFLRVYGLRIATIFALGGFVLSLWYSEIVGLPVCTLCWFARTCMYPLAVILLVAVFRKATDVWPYALTLSGIGMLITGYHHLYQIGIVKGTLCTAMSGGGDCAKRYVFEFDYVTLPLMGFTLFASVALLVWLGRRGVATV